jgi:hypothetical protein
MIADGVIEECQQLLASGVTHREIARRLGISRGTIDSVRSGKRQPGDHQKGKGKNETRQLFGTVAPRKCQVIGNHVVTTDPCLGCFMKIQREIELRRRREGKLPLKNSELEEATLEEYRRREQGGF